VNPIFPPAPKFPPATNHDNSRPVPHRYMGGITLDARRETYPKNSGQRQRFSICFLPTYPSANLVSIARDCKSSRRSKYSPRARCLLDLLVPLRVRLTQRKDSFDVHHISKRVCCNRAGSYISASFTGVVR
jgi:hypothetical protein